VKQVKRYCCDFCDYSTYIKSHLEAHLGAIHGGTKDYKCDACDQVFSVDQNLKRHIRRVHREVIKKFSCELCNHKFLTVAELKSHSSVHVPMTKDFKCEMCDKAYTKKRQLVKHKQKIHKCFFTVVNV
jgi:KRAB domain-containing zinc finger protein